jgi:hypothetical protein
LLRLLLLKRLGLRMRLLLLREMTRTRVIRSIDWDGVSRAMWRDQDCVWGEGAVWVEKKGRWVEIERGEDGESGEESEDQQRGRGKEGKEGDKISSSGGDDEDCSDGSQQRRETEWARDRGRERGRGSGEDLTVNDD